MSLTSRRDVGLESATTGRSDGAAQELADLRVLIVHQWLYVWAGAERVLEQLTGLIPHADVLAGFVTPELRLAQRVAANARETWASQLPFATTRHRWFLPAYALAFATYDTSAYDLVISISHAFEKMVRPRKAGAVHVSYCLSPPRYLWDLSEAHDDLATAMEWLPLQLGRAPLRALDRWSARHVDRFVSLSRHVAERVQRAYGRESAVVYPPVARKPVVGATRRRERFLFSLGRLVPYKRVDLAIAAAERLGIRLIIAGEGPERMRLERLAGPYTEFVGEISEERAGELFSTCAAFVFCAEEDFGITAVEALAHGAPVIAYARGGAMETTVDGVTGVLFSEQNTDAVTAAITSCLARTWDERVLRAHADRFSPEHFRAGIRAEIGAALAGASR